MKQRQYGDRDVTTEVIQRDDSRHHIPEMPRAVAVLSLSMSVAALKIQIRVGVLSLSMSVAALKIQIRVAVLSLSMSVAALKIQIRVALGT